MSNRASAAPADSTVVAVATADAIDVFVRVDNELVQTARLTSPNHLDPTMIATIAADLANTLGWHKVAALTSEVPPTRELPRGTRTGGASASPVRNTPRRAGKKEGTRGRRTKADMAKQDDFTLAYVDTIGEEVAVPTSDIIDVVCQRFGLDPVTNQALIRGRLARWAKEGRIGYENRPVGKLDRAYWFGLAKSERMLAAALATD